MTKSQLEERVRNLTRLLGLVEKSALDGERHMRKAAILGEHERNNVIGIFQAIAQGAARAKEPA